MLLSFRVMAAIFVSLLLIPLWTIGVLGHFRVPFDIISCPGVNIAIGIGVDALINMIFFVRRQAAKRRITREDWTAACARLWRPIFYSTVVVCMGFGIFAFSAFPPTQRFGLSVILSSLMSPMAALFVFPWLAGGGVKKKD
jgi:predicted RND superfamily exporter protein